MKKFITEESIAIIIAELQRIQAINNEVFPVDDDGECDDRGCMLHNSCITIADQLGIII